MEAEKEHEPLPSRKKERPFMKCMPVPARAKHGAAILEF